MQFFIKILRSYRRPVHYQFRFGHRWIRHPFWLDTTAIYCHQMTFPNWIATARTTIIRKFSKPLTAQSNHLRMFSMTNSMDIITMEDSWNNILSPKRMLTTSMHWIASWVDLCHLFRHRVTMFLLRNYRIWDFLQLHLSQPRPLTATILKHIQ